MKQPKYSKNNLKAVNNAKEQSQTKVETRKKEQPETPKERKYPKLQLAAKVFAILAIVICAVNHTDNKQYFEPNKGFRAQKVIPAFHSLIEKDTIDVCLFGSSHIGEGINAHVLSNYLGCTCFSMHQDGSDMQDVYYSLKDVVSQTKIKVAVFETFAMTNVLGLEQQKNKYAKIRLLSTPLKLEAITKMLPLDEYWAGWSSTIRNHNFLFRDTAQINRNLHPADYAPQRFIYLGSEGRQDKCINDSLIAVYDSLGPIVDGEKIGHDEYDLEYFDKIIKLCKENDIKVVFLTIPEYYRNIKNYSSWKSVVNEMVEKTEYPWYDLQEQYDSARFRREFFQGDRLINQHVVMTGAPFFSSVLAAYLKDSLQLNLPDRTKQKRWNDLFYGSEGYYLNYTPHANDTLAHNVCEGRIIANIEIINAYWQIEGKSKGFYVKFNKNTLSKEQAKRPIELLVKGEYQGKEVNAALKVLPADMYAVRNYLYKVNLINEFTPKDIIGLRFPEK